MAGAGCCRPLRPSPSSASTNSFAGSHGVAALAGYGVGSRLEFILVSLPYGIGGPAGILIGTNIGAGNTGRALRVAWIGTVVAVLMAEAIGLSAACWPMAWLGAFSRDPLVLATGSAYLRTVGPFPASLAWATHYTAPGKARAGWDGPPPVPLSAQASPSPAAQWRFAAAAAASAGSFLRRVLGW